MASSPIISLRSYGYSTSNDETSRRAALCGALYDNRYTTVYERLEVCLRAQKDGSSAKTAMQSDLAYLNGLLMKPSVVPKEKEEEEEEEEDVLPLKRIKV